MKRLIALILSFVMLFTGCAPLDVGGKPSNESKKSTENNIPFNKSETVEDNITPTETDSYTSTGIVKEIPTSITGLDDEDLLDYVKETTYTGLVEQLNSDEYYVEGVEAVYYPKEYIEAFVYNTTENVYFGYTPSELNDFFQGQKYVFTLGEDGQTIVIPMEVLSDDTYTKMMQDVMIGTGVILVCVTVSLVAAPAAPAVSVIFAASATTGTKFALESGAISFVSAAIVTGYQTEDFDQAMKAGVSATAEGYKWGAVSGAVIGGAKETYHLAKTTKNGLTMNQAAKLQMETKWPLEAISALHSPEEAEIYKKAGLVPQKLASGEWAFAREIDWKLVDQYGQTNVERVIQGHASIDSTGKPYELHHIGMKADSPLAILTNAEHHAKENYSILHYKKEGKEIADAAWEKQKDEFWNEMLKVAKARGLA